MDVFYLYPTCWDPTDADGLVNTIDNASMRAKAPRVYDEQASGFEGVANVYAPFYRQLNAMKSLSYSLEEQEQLVADVLKFLLSEYMAEHPDVYARMIAAYPLGYSYSKEYFEKNTHLKFAEGETDTQVVISWNCERMEDGRFSSYNLVCHEGALAINPVSWNHDYEKVEADDTRNLGALNTRECYSAQVMYDPERKYEQKYMVNSPH